MTTTYTPLETRNPSWGFYGTMQSAGYPAASAWNTASRMIAEMTGAADDAGGFGPEGVRDFLDSRDGRHFADALIDAETKMIGRPPERLAFATKHTAEWYQSYTIGAQTERDHGIPRGLPHLTGWVQHYAMLAEADPATP